MADQSPKLTRVRYSEGTADDDLYALLGLTMSASAADLKRGRRQQAQKWHPDRNQDKAGHKRMAAINNAFRILNDPVQREAYDQTLLLNWKHGSSANAGGAETPSWIPVKGAKAAAEPANGKDDRPGSGEVTSADFLRSQGFSVVDNRQTGGVLWVVAAPELEPHLHKLRDRGLEFEFAASGGMATGHRPAWWTRTRG
jgi:curved DNA-binding protein CbpA